MTSYEEAFSELYQQAYRVAFRILRVRADADDVAQETMIRAYIRWSKIAGYAEPWVSRASGNLAIDRGRARRRRELRERRTHQMDTTTTPVGDRIAADPDVPLADDVSAALLALPAANEKSYCCGTSPTRAKQRSPRCSDAHPVRSRPIPHAASPRSA
jgi:DNA-directed RNA polymerase specialized sigma24 family protein